MKSNKTRLLSAILVFLMILGVFSAIPFTAMAGANDGPTIIEARIRTDGIGLEWDDNSNNETGFYIGRKIGSDGAWNYFYKKLPANTTTFVDKDVTEGNTYHYAVRSYTEIKIIGMTQTSYSLWTSSVSVLLFYPPSELKTALSDNKATLTWKNNTKVLSSEILIERREGSGAWDQIDKVSTGTVTYKDSTALTGGKTYSYRVRAYFSMAFMGISSKLYSNYSNEATVNVPLPPSPIAAPSNLTAEAGTGGVTLNWKDNSNNEDMFSIYKKTEGGSFTLIKSVAANATTYLDSAVEAGKTYTYYVVSVKTGVGGDSKSNEATVTVPATIVELPPFETLNVVVITEQPADQSINEGESATFTVKAFGKGTLTYKWQFFYDDPGFTGWMDLTDSGHFSGVTTPTMTHSDAAYYPMDPVNNVFRFRCVVSNGTKSATSDEAALIISIIPIVPTITGPESLALVTGYAATATGTYTIDGHPTPNVVIDTKGVDKIKWDYTTNDKIKIEAGLAAGEYPVEIQVGNGYFLTKLNFKLTVADAKPAEEEPAEEPEEPKEPEEPEEPAAGSMANFKKSKYYVPGMFTDVNENSWYGYNNQKVIANAFEYGLMKGSSDTTFNPTGNITLAEAVTVAARVHSIYKTGEEKFVQGSPWYKVYVDYAIANGIIEAKDFTDYDKAATRAQMAYIFSRSLPASEFAEQNTVKSLPDVNSGTSYYNSIITLYKAGIVTGNDDKGTFSPGNNITRAEAAAIISRVILPATRASGKTY